MKPEDIGEDELASSLELDAQATDFRKTTPDEILFSSEMKKKKKLLPAHIADEVSPRRELVNASKSSSTSSLYINSTLSVPNINQVLNCMASALFVHIRAGHASSQKVFLDVFDETKHPLTKTEKFDVRMPKARTLYKFLHDIFSKENLPSEVAILCLAYIERLMKATHLTLHATNWRRVLLSALILASKVWEDQAVWNIDFVDVFPDLDVADLNVLEKHFLRLIDYNVAVTGQLYAQYYFELRELAERDRKEFPLKPLDSEKAKLLEQSSRRREKSMKTFQRRSVSSENIPPRSTKD